MTDKTGAEVIDLIERFNFNLGSAIDCIARADGKTASGTIGDLERAQWYLEREIKRIKHYGESAVRRLKRQLREPPHRFVNSASVNRTAPYGKTGWATSIGSVTGHGSI